MDTDYTLANCVQVTTLIAGRLASRKPLFVLRLAAPFLLRLAERTLAGLLLKDPPRRTRIFTDECPTTHSPSKITPHGVENSREITHFWPGHGPRHDASVPANSPGLP